MSREDQAALLGSECERWLRADVRAPLWIPPRYADLRPLGATAVLDVLDQRRRVSPRANGTIANLYEVQDKIDARSNARIKGFLGTGNEPVTQCACCAGYARAADALVKGSGAALQHVPRFHCDYPGKKQDGASSLVSLVANTPLLSDGLPIQADPPVIEFDQDTWQTTVTESITIDLTAEAVNQQYDAGIMARVREVFRNSSPQNWASSALKLSEADKDPFFLSSVPGIWGANGFEPVPPEQRNKPLKAWNDASGGQLKEITAWSSGFGGNSSSGAVIYLTIKNYKDLTENDTPSLEFDYVLHHCESYQSGPARFRDILDVDGGHFKGSFENGLLRIKASKSIHFRAASAADQDAAVLLNLLAPATTSMLMRELVYDGTLKLLNDRTGVALGASAPSRSAPAPETMARTRTPPQSDIVELSPRKASEKVTQAGFLLDAHPKSS